MAFGIISRDSLIKGKSIPGIVRDLKYMDKEMYQSLKKLTKEQMQISFGDILDKKEIDAMDERRKVLIEAVEKGVEYK